MDAEIKERWLAALESGEFRKARHVLVNNGRYCCLGVLGCVISGTRDVGVIRSIYDGLIRGDIDEDQLTELININDGFPGYPIDYIRDNL